MKKNALSIIVLWIFFIGFASAYVEDKVFCTIWSNSITVTMEKEHNYKCKEYLSVLSQAINTEYNDIISIQKLISQWYDVDFWKEVRETKRDRLKRILTLKEQIETAVAEFDSNLFIKMKDYIVYTVTPYQTKYKKVLKHLNNYKEQGGKIPSDIKREMDYFQEEISVIDKILETSDFDTLVKNFNRHLYLKNLIEWK